MPSLNVGMAIEGDNISKEFGTCGHTVGAQAMFTIKQRLSQVRFLKVIKLPSYWQALQRTLYLSSKRSFYKETDHIAPLF